jgi:hypothetical protein
MRAGSSSVSSVWGSFKTQQDGLSTAQLKSGAANSWGKPNPERGEIFALPLL